MISRLTRLLLALFLACAGETHAQPAASAPGAGGAALTATDASAWLDGLMPTALRLSRIPGAVVVIVKDGVPLVEKGYGVADWDRQTPVDPRATLFRPGSISKLFTWTAVMQLVEQGKLDLDTYVNRYLDAGRYASTRGGPSNFLSIRSVLAPTEVIANDDGTIQVELDGVRHVYAETARPFLWSEVGGKDRLQASVRDGRVARWTFDAGAYESVYEPVPGLAGTALMQPLLLVALGVMLATALQWPCATLARRYHRVPRPPAGAAAHSLRGVRLGSVLTLLALAAWMGVLAWLFSEFTDIPGAVLATQLLTLVALAGGSAAALWRLAMVLRPGHGAGARIAAFAWVASFGLLLCTAIATHWIGFNPNY